MIKNWGFIFMSEGSNPVTDRLVLERNGVLTTLVAVPNPAVAPAIATELVENGAELIELCGFFGPVWTAKVIEATGKRVPVGAVSFGAESLVPLANLVTAAA